MKFEIQRPESFGFTNGYLFFSFSGFGFFKSNLSAWDFKSDFCILLVLCLEGMIQSRCFFSCFIIYFMLLVHANEI
uniref:Putative ovule protein n=1 Tax=Solanum chacoense TaxID=4108 RepID=A0A0V0GF74_SOLCH